nr:reverse transcriptase domain-containing protein [Tanacetum cinerariifolium]
MGIVPTEMELILEHTQQGISHEVSTQKHRKPRRKVTEVPQPSDHIEHVADEVIYKELDDTLVRDATTAFSLEAEHDSGGRPRCQDTMRDTIAQTRSGRVSKLSNDSLLARGNTLQSDEDRLKLNELMELCTTLQSKVLDLEKTKTTQALEIDSLKRRVKKLKKKQRSRTHKLKRLYKVGLSSRVESSYDNEDLGKDASKQGRKIYAIDSDEDITLVNDQDDEQIFDVNDLQEEEVFVQEVVVDKEVNAAGEVNVASIAITISAAATITNEEVTLAKALAELKASKPKVKGVFTQEPKPVRPKLKDQIMLDEEVALKLQAELQAKFDKEQRPKRRKSFAAKRVEEKRNRPPTRAQQRSIMCTYLKNMKGWKLNSLKNKSFTNIQELFDKAMKRVNTFIDYRTKLVEESSKKAEAEVMEGSLKKSDTELEQESSKRAGTELEQESSKKQKIDDDKETYELKQLVKIIPDEEGVATDAMPLAVKPPSIVDWKIYKEGKKSYYKIIKADGSLKVYLVFSHMLKSFDREDVETLWKLVKAKHGSTRPEEDYKRVLRGDIFEIYCMWTTIDLLIGFVLLRSYFPPANTIPRHSRRKNTSIVESEIQTNATMVDNRTMAQMLQAPIEGYEDAIVVPPINANNFGLKQTLINLVQSNQFTGSKTHITISVSSTKSHPRLDI